MAIDYVVGPMLKNNLDRAGNNLSFTNANVGINTLSPGSELEVAGNITVGNIVIPNVGNISAGNVKITNLATPTANADAATKFYVDQQVAGNITSIGNLTVTDTTVTTVAANANVIFTNNGANGLFVLNYNTAFVVPVGNAATQPGQVGQPAAVTGMLRFNSTTGRLEYYDGAEWDQVAGGVTNETFNGDNITVNFNLSRKTTAAAVLVMLNGVVQLPTTAYSITGAGANVLTFTQAPQTGDVIDVRYL